MLAHQLPALPAFNQFRQALPEAIEWMHGLAAKTVKAGIPIDRQAIDATWRPPAMAQAWHAAAPLERIRFAGANRLCVNLHYQNKFRLIEPYSLRRTQAGNILLYALRHETMNGEHIEWIESRVQKSRERLLFHLSFCFFNPTSTRLSLSQAASCCDIVPPYRTAAGPHFKLRQFLLPCNFNPL